jgi:predicted nucleic acid-binding protein
MPPKVYIETTIISYLASRPSGKPSAKIHQELTHHWWLRRRSRFELYISEVVLEEAGRGHEDAARARLALLEAIPVLAVTADARQIAAAILRSNVLTAKSAADALHIGVATVNAMDFLLSWNCTHIANAIVYRGVSAICRGMGYEPPVVCTPEELMEG